MIFPIPASTAEFYDSYNIYHKTKLIQKLFLAIIMSHFCSYTCLKGGCNEVEIDLFAWVTSDRTIGNGLKFHQRKFRLYIRKIFFTEIVQVLE